MCIIIRPWQSPSVQIYTLNYELSQSTILILYIPTTTHYSVHPYWYINMFSMFVQRFARTLGRFRIFVVFLLAVAGIYLLYLPESRDRYKTAQQCYHQNRASLDENIILLEDITDSKNQPKPGQSIFFHETSCTNGIVKLNARWVRRSDKIIH